MRRASRPAGSPAAEAARARELSEVTPEQDATIDKLMAAAE
jgi:hypothetical protein